MLVNTWSNHGMDFDTVGKNVPFKHKPFEYDNCVCIFDSCTFYAQV